MYEYIGILLGARPILHISRIKVKETVISSVQNECASFHVYPTVIFSIPILKRTTYVQPFRLFQFAHSVRYLPYNNNSPCRAGCMVMTDWHEKGVILFGK
jgi:hypothetical protein